MTTTPLTEAFAEPAALVADFATTSIAWIALFVIGAAVLRRAERKRPVALPLSVYVLGSTCLSVLTLLLAADSTLNRFASLTVSPNALTLNYPLTGTRDVKLDQLTGVTVLFGIAGKAARNPVSCYLAIQLPNGDTLRSAPRPESLSDCKALAASVSRALADLGPGPAR